MRKGTVGHSMSWRFSSDVSSLEVRLVATHRTLGRVACAPHAIDRHHGRNGMFEHKLHSWTRPRQNCKRVRADKLPACAKGVRFCLAYQQFFVARVRLAQLARPLLPTRAPPASLGAVRVEGNGMSKPRKARLPLRGRCARRGALKGLAMGEVDYEGG
jgi:hypothetical protein